MTGNLLVASGITLTIEPGVTVKFNRDLYMHVDGTMVASGTESDIITFTSNQASPAPGDWKHIYFRDSAVDATFDANSDYVNGCILEHCKIEYGTNVVRGDYATPFINHSTVINNSSIGIHIENPDLDSTCRVTNCTVSNNGELGIHLSELPNSIIDNCDIIGNGNHGIWIHNSEKSSINNCTVTDNNWSGIACSASH